MISIPVPSRLLYILSCFIFINYYKSLTDVTFSRLFRWPIVPIVRTTDVEADVECYRLSTQMAKFDYEHNYIKVAQLRPPVTKVVIGSINWAQGNRIMSSFYHFAY